MLSFVPHRRQHVLRIRRSPAPRRRVAWSCQPTDASRVRRVRPFSRHNCRAQWPNLRGQGIVCRALVIAGVFQQNMQLRGWLALGSSLRTSGNPQVCSQAKQIGTLNDFVRAGDTIGGIGSAIAVKRGTFRKNFDGTYSGTLVVQPDRGFNVYVRSLVSTSPHLTIHSTALPPLITKAVSMTSTSFLHLTTPLPI